MTSRTGSTSSAAGNLAVAVPAGITAVVVGGYVLRKWWKSRSAPPTFTTNLPVIGGLVEFLKDPLVLIRNGYDKHGKCFKVNMLAKEFVFLVGEEGHDFFFNSDKYLDQAKMYSFMIPIFGKKVLYDADYHTRMAQLRFIRERLTDNCLDGYCGTLEAEVAQFFAEEWKDKGVVDIRDSMVDLLTRTSVRCLMGKELRSKLHENGDQGSSVSYLLHTLEQGMLPLSVFAPNFPCPRHWKRDAARREMSSFIMPILKARRARMASGNADEESDFLWSVMNSTYPDGRAITDEEIVGFLIAAFFGGMHNSSITTAWTTLEITTRPELYRELQQEQKETVGNGKFTFEAWKKMVKLRAVINEVLRVHPPLMLLMRTVEADIKFKQYSIPRGSVVAVSPNVGMMLPEIYPEPETFKPHRFLEAAPKENQFIPFGGGRRLCKGQEFGYLQVMCSISYMLRNYDLEALDGVTAPRYDMVVAPSQPCRIAYKRRA
jgi:sterol 14-demethylase